jgi:tagatose-1,6-bisphosphate aldolase non-catalytic subunit AgaZ/GatZ
MPDFLGLLAHAVLEDVLVHDPEKWKPFFRKDHAQSKYKSVNRFNLN